MNIERAAEIILEGDAWEDCLECSGIGRTQSDAISIHCEECFGRGVILNLDYALACNILNKPVPEFERPNYIFYKNSPEYDRIVADVDRLTEPHVSQNIFNIRVDTGDQTQMNVDVVLVVGSFPYDD